MITIRCKKCGGAHCIKNGIVRNKQKFKCKSCGYSFVLTDQKKKNKKDKQELSYIHTPINGSRYGL